MMAVDFAKLVKRAKRRADGKWWEQYFTYDME